VTARVIVLATRRDTYACCGSSRCWHARDIARRLRTLRKAARR